MGLLGWFTGRVTHWDFRRAKQRLTGTMAMDLEFMAFTHLNFTLVILTASNQFQGDSRMTEMTDQTFILSSALFPLSLSTFTQFPPDLSRLLSTERSGCQSLMSSPSNQVRLHFGPPRIYIAIQLLAASCLHLRSDLRTKPSTYPSPIRLRGG